MTNDEIKEALRNQCKIAHLDKTHRTAIVYDHAQAWRVTVDKFGRFISSLELVTGGNHPSVTIANADECELWEGEIKWTD